MHISAIILAAGSGKRMGGNVKKQYLDLCGHSILWYSLRAFEDSDVDEIIIVCAKEDIERSDAYRSEFHKLTNVVTGGAQRYNSVHHGLKATEGCDLVLIHDGARPFVSTDIINGCIRMLDTEEGCVAAVPSKDTVKIVDRGGYVISTPDRDSVWIMQTPQAFRYTAIRPAYDRLIEAEESGTLVGVNITDDAMVAEHFGNIRVKMAEGSYDNIKITTPSDLVIGQAILSGTVIYSTYRMTN